MLLWHYTAPHTEILKKANISRSQYLRRMMCAEFMCLYRTDQRRIITKATKENNKKVRNALMFLMYLFLLLWWLSFSACFPLRYIYIYIVGSLAQANMFNGTSRKVLHEKIIITFTRIWVSGIFGIFSVRLHPTSSSCVHDSYM